MQMHYSMIDEYMDQWTSVEAEDRGWRSLPHEGRAHEHDRSPLAQSALDAVAHHADHRTHQERHSCSHTHHNACHTP